VRPVRVTEFEVGFACECEEGDFVENSVKPAAADIHAQVADVGGTVGVA